MGNYGMAAMVTIIFADEAHREAWLKTRVLDGQSMKDDYERRSWSQNLVYIAGPLQGSEFLTDMKEKTHG